MLEELRERVAGAHQKRSALESLSVALGPRQYRALVTALEQWTELRTSVAFLLIHRPRRGLVRPLWRSWQRFPTVPEIRSVLLFFVEQFGWEEAVEHELGSLVDGWVRAADPGVSIQAWLEVHGKSFSDLGQVAGSLLLDETPLTRLVRDAVMTHGSAIQLHREGSTSLILWHEELSPTAKLAFGQNYLVKLRTEEWDRPLLNLIEQGYGLPKRPKVARFWNPVPPHVQTTFQLIFIRHRLVQELGSGTDRQKYWAKWQYELCDVTRGFAGDTRYAVLDFGRFGVIEFFKDGNAAYFYEADKLQRMAQVNPTKSGDLKSWEMPSFGWKVEHRLIHRGHWYPEADDLVSRWKRVTGG